MLAYELICDTGCSITVLYVEATAQAELNQIRYLTCDYTNE
jgi:hypothetical protein